MLAGSHNFRIGLVHIAATALIIVAAVLALSLSSPRIAAQDATPDPNATSTPETVADPNATSTPETVADPNATSTPETVADPDPSATPTPETVADPNATSTSETVPDPSATSTPAATGDSTATTTPETTPEADMTPTVSDTSELRTHTVVLGEEFSVTLPAADPDSGNGGPYDYNVWHQGQAASFTNGIDGITFDPAARTLSGTPRQAGLYEMSYVIHDGDANRDGEDAFRERDALRVEVTEPALVREQSGPPSFPASVDDFTFIQEQDIGAQTLPEAAGGAGGFTYSLSPDLPEGLSFDAASRAISGAPATTTESAAYTYTATDSEGAQAELTFSIAVLLTLPPYFPASVDSYTFTQEQDIGAQTLPEAAGGAGGFTYSLSPALPEGMSFDPASRALTGAPAATSESAEYTYTATDSEGAQAELTFTIQILRTGQSNAAAVRVRGETPSLQVTWNAHPSSKNFNGNTGTLRYYLVQYKKEGSTALIGEGFLKVTETSAIFRNLEPGVTYQFEKVAYYEICATGYGCDNYPDGVFTWFASGMTNQPPTLAGGGLDTLWIDFTEAQSTFTLNSVFNVSDPDDNPLLLTYTATSGDPSILSVSLEFIPGFFAVPGFAVPGFWNVTFAPKRPGSATVTYLVEDGYGGSLTVSHTVVFNSLRRSVVENSNAGVNVGLPVSGPGAPEGSVTLTGAAAALSPSTRNPARSR